MEVHESKVESAEIKIDLLLFFSCHGNTPLVDTCIRPWLLMLDLQRIDSELLKRQRGENRVFTMLGRECH